MMKFIFKRFRSIQLVNMLVRRILRWGHSFITKASAHWAIYGSVGIEFDDVSFKLYSEADDHQASALYYGYQIGESRDLKCFLKFARKSRVILDIGANVGIYTVLSSLANKEAFVYSFEPNEINRQRLNRNIKLNHLSNVNIISKAVGAEDATIQFTIPVSDVISDTSSVVEDFSKKSYSGELEWKKVEVEQTSIDSFYIEESVKNVDLIKIDVEGYEMAVFDGASECIKKFHPVIQCEIFVDEDRKAFFDRFLKQYSYTAYMLLSEGLLRLDHGVQKQSGSNFIFIKQVLPDLLTPVDKAVDLVFSNQSINS